MSHLFFVDESGHDRRQMPYEVHGGIAVPMSRVWELIQLIEASQRRRFGAPLHEFGVEGKGERLLRRRIFQFARQPGRNVSEQEQRDLAREFLTKGQREHDAVFRGQVLRLPRHAAEFRAFGRACLEHAEDALQACLQCDATVLAAVVDRESPRPLPDEWKDELRKDFVLLFERLYYLMENRPTGCMAAVVFDAQDDLRSEKCVQGYRLNRLIARYFMVSHTGRLRASRIIPELLYVRSDLTSLMSVSDLAIYVVNHGFRPQPQWAAPVREELRPYVDWIYRLQKALSREDGSSISSIFRVEDLRPTRA